MDLSYQLPVIKEIVVENTTTAGDIEFMLSHFAPRQLFFAQFRQRGSSWNDVQNGEILNAGIVQDFCQRFPILLGIGIQASELSSMLEYLQPAWTTPPGWRRRKPG